MYITDDDLRKQVKELKCYQEISYTELSEYLEVSRNAFYNWMNGYYSMSDERKTRLQEIIDILKE